MTPFNLFKKSPKKSSKEEILGPPELQKNRVDAATEVMGMYDRYFKSSQESHPGTILSAAAWLTGTSLYRSFGEEHAAKPRTMILSEGANQELPKLLNLFLVNMARYKIVLQQDQLIQDTPDSQQPQETILQVQDALQDEYNAIMMKHGLNYLEGARSGTIVCSMLLNYFCNKLKVLDLEIGASIISKGFIAGAKTIPMPMEPESSKVTSDNEKGSEATELIRTISESSISGSGRRLVLGEKDAAIQDALDNGGKFILVHPEVESQLKGGNFDPFLIHVTALIIEMESKISQIDFVNVDVDKLLQEWSGKAHDQASTHIRLMLWLQENAEGYGYQRSGNSWNIF